MSQKRIYQFCLDTECEDILDEIPRGARSEWIRNLMKESKIIQINQNRTGRPTQKHEQNHSTI